MQRPESLHRGRSPRSASLQSFFCWQNAEERFPQSHGGALAAIVLLGLVPIIAQLGGVSIYRVRVTVLSSTGTPVEDAKVWSSIGGEAKRVAGGWQFDIPAALRPVDGKLTVWASIDSSFLKGSEETQLAADHNPTVTIQLTQDKTATVSGRVIERHGMMGIVGARVNVEGYESEGVISQAGGSFVLPAHAAVGQSVVLHAEADDYNGVTQWHPAGDEPATIILDRR
jgi:hypothetical protein